MSEEKEQELEEVTISDLFKVNIDRFLEELSALNDTLPIQIMLLSVKYKQLIERLDEISTTSEEINDKGEEVIVYRVISDPQDEFPKLHKHLNRTDIAKKIIPRNFIVSIVSQYDAFVGELVRILYEINPNLIRSSEKDITPNDLFNYESIEELKGHIVDKEVDSLLREEHLEQLKVLERRISKVTKKEFTLTKSLPVLKDFVELTQRRNLFVHTNGIITRQYLDSHQKWKFNTKIEIELNNELKAEQDYCENSYKILFEIGVKLAHVLWRKFLPEYRKDADDHLNDIIFELLLDNEYSLAIEIANFGTDIIKKFSSEQIRKFIVINKAIAYKMLGKNQDCQDIIRQEDWSVGNEFKLAKFVLEEDYEKAKDLMLKIGPNDDLVKKSSYESWPLFKLFRKTEEFKSGYYELFNEEFSFQEVQSKEKVEQEEPRVQVETTL